MNLQAVASRAADRHHLPHIFDHLSIAALEHITQQNAEPTFAAIHRALMGEDQFHYYLRIAQEITCNPTH